MNNGMTKKADVDYFKKILNSGAVLSDIEFVSGGHDQVELYQSLI